MSNDTTTHHVLPETEAEAAVDHSEVHEVSEKQYIVIALLLAVLTALEVASTEVGLGSILIPALLIMMAVKFFIVISYFMHLKFDSKLFSLMFYLGLFGAVILYSAMLTTFHFFAN